MVGPYEMEEAEVQSKAVFLKAQSEQFASVRITTIPRVVQRPHQ